MDIALKLGTPSDDVGTTFACQFIVSGPLRFHEHLFLKFDYYFQRCHFTENNVQSVTIVCRLLSSDPGISLNNFILCLVWIETNFHLVL